MARRGLTQQALGTCLDLSHRAVGKWLSGESIPRAEVAKKLADFFEVAVEDLLDDTRELPQSAQRPPFPDWWEKMPAPRSFEQLAVVLPDVHARLRIAADHCHAGYRAAAAGKPLTEGQEFPLRAAFDDLKLTGTGFTETPYFDTLAKAYQAELFLLRDGQRQSSLSSENNEVAELKSRLAGVGKMLSGIESMLARFFHGGVTPGVEEKLAESRRLNPSGVKRRSVSHEEPPQAAGQ